MCIKVEELNVKKELKYVITAGKWRIGREVIKALMGVDFQI